MWLFLNALYAFDIKVTAKTPHYGLVSELTICEVYRRIQRVTTVLHMNIVSHHRDPAESFMRRQESNVGQLQSLFN